MRNTSLTLGLSLLISICNLQAQNSVFTANFQGIYATNSIEIHHLNNIGKTSNSVEVGAALDNVLCAAYISGVIEEFNSFILASNMGMMHGGISLGYQFLPEKNVHLLSKFKLGIGQTNSEEPYYYIPDPNNQFDYYQDDVLVFKPELIVEINVIPYVKLNLMGSYQYTKDLDNNPLFETDRYKGFGGGIGVSVGLFKFENPNKHSLC